MGPPGTGKSYLASRLARRIGANLVQSDAIRKDRFPRPTYSSKESAIVYGEAHRRIEESLIGGRDVIFDATNLEEDKRRHLYEIAERSRATLTLVWMWAPVNVIARRLWQRGTARDPEDRSDANWQVYWDLAKTAQRPIRPFILLNSALDVENQLAVLDRMLRD